MEKPTPSAGHLAGGLIRVLIGALVVASVLLAVAGCSGPSAAVTPAPTVLPSASPSVAETTAPAPTLSAAVDLTTFHAVWNMIEPGATTGFEDQMAAVICSGFATGVDMGTQEQSIEAAQGVNSVTAGLMIHAAVEYTCPENARHLSASTLGAMPTPESTAIVGSPTTSGPKAVDDAFLTSWHTLFPDEMDSLAIAQALNICDSFKVGNAHASVAQTLQASGTTSAADAEYMISAAVISYCPEFSGQ